MVRYSRCRQEEIRVDDAEGLLFQRKKAISALSSFIPVMTNVTVTLASDDPALFKKSPAQYCSNRNANPVGFPKIMKMVRILGLMAVISYMTVILFTWIYANLEGYEYFSAGEPELIIKYSEWALGAIGIFAAFDCLRKELKDEMIYKDENGLISTDTSSYR